MIGEPTKTSTKVFCDNYVCMNYLEVEDNIYTLMDLMRTENLIVVLERGDWKHYCSRCQK